MQEQSCEKQDLFVSGEGGYARYRIPALAVSRTDEVRLRRGQAVLLRGRDAPAFQGIVYATCQGRLVALGEVERGELLPRRVFNLSAEEADVIHKGL